MDEQERQFALIVSAESAIEIARGEGRDVAQMVSDLNVQKAIRLDAEREASARTYFGLAPSP